MKVWIKLCLGAAIGILLAAFLPKTAPTQELFEFLANVAINVGRYVLFPLVFFSLAMATCQLRLQKKAGRVYARIVIYCVLTTLTLAALGALSVTIFAPERIPIIYEQKALLSAPQPRDILITALPANAFHAFVTSADVLLPLVVFAILVGANLTFNTQITKPVAQFLDSAGRLCYQINTVIVELYGICLIVIAVARFTDLLPSNIERFKQLLILIGLDILVVVLFVYPLLLYVFARPINPYKWLYATIAAAITALVTGDELVPVGMLAKHGKESLGMKRMAGASGYAFFALFGRGGTALVSGTAAILVLKSYSSLEIPILDLLQVVGYAVLFSFCLGSTPGLGTVLSLAMLCKNLGIEEGYLILSPIAPLLISAAVLLDVVTASFVTYLIAHQEKMTKVVAAREFI